MPRPDWDETDFEYGYGLSLGLISPSPPYGQDTRGCHPVHAYKEVWRPTDTHPSRRSFGTARRIQKFIRKPLGLNP
jgi:hypothetical protein